MASWKGKMNLPKSTSKGTSLDQGSHIQPSTSKGGSWQQQDTVELGGMLTTPDSTGTRPIEAQPLNNAAEQAGIDTHLMDGIYFEGFLHGERVKSFTEGNWPPWYTGGDRGNKRKLSEVTCQITCTPHELATAGFIYLPYAKQVKCFICHRTMGINEFESSTDPWSVHEKMFRDCPLIKLGKPSRPDDYTVSTVLMLMGESGALKLEYEYGLLEARINHMLEVVGDEEE